MASLNLLQNYGSTDSSEGEEDPSRTEKAPENSPQKKKRKGEREKLPLPSELKNMFSESLQNEVKENSELFGGRIRTFQHVRGNWASFAHIPLESSDAVKHQVDILQETLKEIPDHNIQLCEDWHLTLSKTIVLRHHWIDSFTASLGKNVVAIKRFPVIFQNFSVYVNDEKSRSFIGMDVHASIPLLQLVKACDATLTEFELEPYYKNPLFHVSLCWTVGDASDLLRGSVLPLLNAKWASMSNDEPDLQSHLVDSVRFKTGNKLYTFPLSS